MVTQEREFIKEHPNKAYTCISPFKAAHMSRGSLGFHPLSPNMPEVSSKEPLLVCIWVIDHQRWTALDSFLLWLLVSPCARQEQQGLPYWSVIRTLWPNLRKNSLHQGKQAFRTGGLWMFNTLTKTGKIHPTILTFGVCTCWCLSVCTCVHMHVATRDQSRVFLSFLTGILRQGLSLSLESTHPVRAAG